MMGMLNRAAVRAKAKLMQWEEEEQGMGIIQVLVLLAIGLGLVAVFIAFRDQIMGAVSEQVDNFMKTFTS